MINMGMGRGFCRAGSGATTQPARQAELSELLVNRRYLSTYFDENYFRPGGVYGD
jgi:hypothetical protein